MATVQAKQLTSDFKGDHLSAKMFGAKGSSEVLALSGAHAGGSTSITVPGHDFDQPHDDGPYQGIEIAGAAASGDPYIGKVIAVAGNILTISPATVTSVSDGTTVLHEETAAIQAGLDNVGDAGGGELRISKGRSAYRIRTITIPSNTTLSLEDGAALDIIDDGTATGRSVFLDGVENVTIQGGKITSSNAASRTGVYGNIRMQNCTNVRVIGVDIEGSSATGVHAINVAGLLIRDCKISETWADGVHISRGCSNVRILGNEMSHVGDDGVGLVGYKYGGTIDTVYPAMFDVVVANNTIKNLTKLVGRGISIHGCVNCVIEGNTIDTVFDSGILVGAVGGDDPVNATHYTHHLTIKGNTIRNVGEGEIAAKIGIFVSYARHFIIEGNTVFNSPGDGITVFAVAKDGKIKGNDVSQVAGRGIIIEQVAQTEERLIEELFTDLGDPGLSSVGISEIQVSGNTVCKVTDAQGIIFSGESGFKIIGALIEHNNIYDVGAHGIYLSDTIKSTVTGNRIFRPAAAGITVGGDYAEISNNTIFDGASDGITFIDVQKCKAVGNTVINCEGGGIYSDPGSEYIFATGNVVFDNVAFQIFLDTSTHNNSAAYNNFGHDYQAGDQGYYQAQPGNPYGVWVGGDPASVFNRVKDYAGSGNPATGLGQVGSTWRNTDGGGFFYKIASALWINLRGFFEYVTGSTTAIRTIGGIDQVGIGMAPDPGVALDVAGGHTRGQLRVLDSVAGGPARIPSSTPKLIGPGKIDLANTTTDVTGKVGIGNGGTNAVTAAAALTNLGAYSKSEVDVMISDLQSQIDDVVADIADHEARITTLESNLTALQGAYAAHTHTVYVTTVTHSHADPQGGTTGTANVNEPAGGTSAPA